MTEIISSIEWKQLTSDETDAILFYETLYHIVRQPVALSESRGLSLSESVRAVDRALDILLCFTQEKPVLSLTEIADEVGISKSTVHRLLATLECKRFLIRDSVTGKYHLGFQFLEMASQVLEDVDQDWALPYLQHLSDECGETVDLAVLDDDHVIYLQVVESSQRVKIAASVGQRLPAYCTATGKAFLANLPEEQVQNILSSGLTRYTENTLLVLEDLKADLDQTRQRGFAISEQEYEKDINAVAAPILSAEGYPIAAIAIVGPSFRLTRERMLMLGQTIQKVIVSIAREIGLAALSALVPRNNSWH
jgi:DNA-binding IclR family transcriptional regulator